MLILAGPKEWLQGISNSMIREAYFDQLELLAILRYKTSFVLTGYEMRNGRFQLMNSLGRMPLVISALRWQCLFEPHMIREEI